MSGRLPSLTRAACVLLLAALSLAALALPAAAREEIRFFSTNTVLRTDGSVDVTESLDVNAEGDQIRHGIFRDVITVLRNDDGSKYYSTLAVVSVKLDDHDEPYTTEGISTRISWVVTRLPKRTRRHDWKVATSPMIPSATRSSPTRAPRSKVTAASWRLVRSSWVR